MTISTSTFVCPSVRPSVCPSVRPSVRPRVCPKISVISCSPITNWLFLTYSSFHFCKSKFRIENSLLSNVKLQVLTNFWVVLQDNKTEQTLSFKGCTNSNSIWLSAKFCIIELLQKTSAKLLKVDSYWLQKPRLPVRAGIANNFGY